MYANQKILFSQNVSWLKYLDHSLKLEYKLHTIKFTSVNAHIVWFWYASIFHGTWNLPSFSIECTWAPPYLLMTDWESDHHHEHMCFNELNSFLHRLQLGWQHHRRYIFYLWIFLRDIIDFDLTNPKHRHLGPCFFDRWWGGGNSSAWPPFTFYNICCWPTLLVHTAGTHSW